MIYESSEHPDIKVGQVWSSSSLENATILIVAIDSSPNGLTINAYIEDGREINGVKNIFAPISLEMLIPELEEIIKTNQDVSEHLDSYDEWKCQAQAGKAGVWACSPAKIFSNIRGSKDV